ncbi:hypothetical protein [Legionella gresilensis]|uniref:hypothetical protein n=1 Tax=Legionella gresilensis TaxID=91823 RepID=UPI001040EEFC|nr:hypothetical protein [Legionella gresilensis]
MMPQGGESFAAKLHAELYKITSNDIPVIARLHIVQTIGINNVLKEKQTMNLDLTWDEGYADITNLANHKSKQPGSKVIFTNNEQGEQIRLDYYSKDWQRRLMSTIETEISNTNNERVAERLKAWHNNM